MRPGQSLGWDIAIKLNKFQYQIHFISHINEIFHPFIIFSLVNETHSAYKVQIGLASCTKCTIKLLKLYCNQRFMKQRIISLKWNKIAYFRFSMSLHFSCYKCLFLLYFIILIKVHMQHFSRFGNNSQISISELTIFGHAFNIIHIHMHIGSCRNYIYIFQWMITRVFYEQFI